MQQAIANACWERCCLHQKREREGKKKKKKKKNLSPHGGHFMVACNNATRYTGVTEAANPMSGVACMCFDSADSNNVDLYQS